MIAITPSMQIPSIASLTEERDNLSAKYTSLTIFLKGQIANGYTEEHRRLVNIQALHVKIQRDCLNLRIKILEDEANE